MLHEEGMWALGWITALAAMPDDWIGGGLNMAANLA